MAEIEINTDKLTSAYRSINNISKDFVPIKEVNIPSSIASELKTDDYYSKLGAVSSSLTENTPIDKVQERLKKIILSMTKSGLMPSMGLGFDDLIDNYGEALDSGNLSKGIDLSNLSIAGILVKPGDIISIKNEYGGQAYKVYIPKNVTSETNITVFYPGTDGIEGENDSKVLQNYLQSNGSDQIIFMSNGGNDASDKLILEGMNSIRKECGINNPINVFGFSKGTRYCEMFARKCLSDGIGVNNLVIIEAPTSGGNLVWADGQNGNNKNAISTLKDGGVNVTIFSGGNIFKDNSVSRKALTTYELNYNYIEDSLKGHPEVLKRLINNGIIDGIEHQNVTNWINSVNTEGNYTIVQ